MKSTPSSQHLMRMVLCLSLSLFSLSLLGQRPASEGGESPKKEEKKGPKPFRDVITADAKSTTGMVTVHEQDDKFFFEIPDSIFERDIMAVTRIAKTPTGAGYGGEQANRQVLRFERGPSDKVFLRVVNFINVSADSTEPIYQAVRNSNVDPIAAAFDIKSIREDTSVLVDVTSFFNDPNQAITLPPRVEQRYRLKNLAKDRSYIESIRSYPINVEIRTVKTYNVNPPSPNQRSSSGPSRTVDLPGGSDAGAVTFELNTSMILLPKVPMRRRISDPRVGIFSSRYTVYDGEGQRAREEEFAVRWRLEAKNAADAARQQRGELIEPRKPIVFYIDPATPVKWRPYLKQGVEDWQVAFEQAGWKNAILAKDWPTDDPSMSLEDARFSVIRYFASDIQNAYGPNVHDPRSGEILESHIGWYHNVMKLLKRWYSTQAGAVDARARKNEFDDELMGQLVRFVSSHEVGHTLGMRHNFGASNATPVEKLRDPAFVNANGHTSSIMDYARFNYVAQPGDGVTDLFPRIGDYDRWAIEWNYKPIYGTGSADEDKKILNRWYLEKAAPNPRMHFLSGFSTDPRVQTEDLGDNAMLASEYGIKNLQRILPNAVEWTREEAEGFEMAKEMYDNVVGQYRRYIGHVSKWVGGVYENLKTYDQNGAVYEPAPRQQQREAVNFLNRQLFQTPEWLLNKAVLSLITPEHGVESIAQIQESTLKSLLGTSRLQRMIETKAAYPNAYGIDELFDDLRNGIMAEVRSGAPVSSIYRRNLQKIFVETLIDMQKPKASGSSGNSNGLDPSLTDIMSVTRGTLRELSGELEKAADQTDDRMSRYHLQDLHSRIEEALDLDD